MPLNMTKIAFSAESPASLRAWLESHPDEALMTTRYLPKRHEEMIGGSLYWIFEHALIGRSPIVRFSQREDGRWHIHLEPRLIPVVTQPKRAHQGWRYLTEEAAPRDLAEGETASDAMPPKLARELAKLGLV
ncbi:MULTISPECIES: DUF1489 family protein [Novosphingobium]|jgi:hypothetical protein|uniref:Lysophospholipase n=1 Tax=Novosphingobium resinovorum TaxID=158500 RepID=A0A1D8A7M8_9SPHN|nr:MULTISPECIES: DUF1489 domain-containing protein [Novosphingobium]AOR78080.1 hypothetical protein BES08_15945 [Novosphingobium resinovorum]GLK42271.1 hypothetical protein GCM10017612_01880 [Novosphingobium resinovorum]